MEQPVPDLIYYQRLVDNKRTSLNTFRFEMQELIDEVKIYMRSIQNKNNKEENTDTTN